MTPGVPICGAQRILPEEEEFSLEDLILWAQKGANISAPHGVGNNPSFKPQKGAVLIFPKREQGGFRSGRREIIRPRGGAPKRRLFTLLGVAPHPRGFF